MTEQEVFDKVVNHLLKQNKKAAKFPNPYRSECMYKNSEGLKCAVGCLIPDDKYQPYMENMRSDEILNEIGLEKLNINFIDELQKTHDHFMVREWGERLKHIAEKFNLVYRAK